MRRRYRYLILTALLVSVGIGIGFLLVRGHLLKSPDRLLEEAARLVDLRVENIDYTHIHQGRREWSLKATHVNLQKDTELFELKNVKLIIYQEGARRVAIDGREGLYNREKKWITITGDATIVNSNGYTLKTESFTYYSQKRLLTSDRAVVFTGPGVRIEGVGLRFDLEHNKAHFLNRVLSVFDESEGEKDA